MQKVLSRAEAAQTKERPAMHRVGTIKGRIEEPKNLGERLISRRLELKLSQGQVADQVSFWNQTKQDWGTLSRSAYCMYESGDVVPDIPKIEQLAKALKCAPQWLAFGDGNRAEVEEVDYDPETDEFVSKTFWHLNEEWIQSSTGVEPSDLTLIIVANNTSNLKAGDVALVLKGSEPTIHDEEYVFAQDKNLVVASIIKPGRGGNYRIYDVDGRSHREVPFSDLRILGKVLGKIASI
jgi:transcriptional regulator with XRE-family HTH domain